MRKYKAGSIMIIAGIYMILFATPVFADSSWKWISDMRPYDVFPFVVIGTLLIETISINYIPKVNKLAKVFCVVTLGNLLSYAAPYFFRAIVCYSDHIYSFTKSLVHVPLYNIGIAYLIITIIIELPVDYLLLKKDTKKNKTLIFTILGANILTTALVAVVERTLCYGYYI